MRRLLAILAALALLATIPAAVTAKKPTQFNDHFVAMSCEGIAPTSGTGFLFLGVTISDEFGPDAFVDMWNAASPDGPPDISRDFAAPVDASYVGGTLTASIPLLDASGDPAGTGTVSATLTPVGDPFSFEDNFKDGNANVRFTQNTQPLGVVGTADIGGKTFALDACFAEDTTISEWRTNPNTFVVRFDSAFTDCTVTNSNGAVASVFFDPSTDETFVDVFLESGPGAPLGAFGVVTLTDGSGSGSLELYDPDTGEPIAGTGSIDLSLTEGPSYSYVLRSATGRSVVRGSLIDVEGTLTLPGISPFDLTSCVAFVGTEKVAFHNSKGPKPSGKAPANDLPGGAKLLAVGGKTSQQTRGASPDREAPYSCLTFEDPPGEIFEIPVGHTVWFRVQGTGSEVTVDTAGSDYDTVAAAYVSDGAGGFTEVACVDDVPLEPFGRTLQAAITFPTEVGTTYYVQIGGFPDDLTYGNLRIAVR